MEQDAGESLETLALDDDSDAEFMLLDSSELKLDGKGRIVLAAAQRRQIGDSAVIRQSKTMGCLELVPRSVFIDLLKRLSADKSAKGTRILAAVTFQSKEVSIDKQGRLSIPSKFRTNYGIGDTVVVSGGYDRLYIWNPDAWDKFMSITSEEVLDNDAVEEYGL